MIKRIITGLLLGSMISVISAAGYKSGAQKLIDQVDPNMNIGIDVVDLTTGVRVYRRNPGKLFTPASNMKLFSNAAALMVLGPDYRFRNELSAGASELQKGVLQGNLYIKLPGDPSFDRERLAVLLSTLKAWHIHRIHGNVVIDSDHAGLSAYAPGSMISDRVYSYGAPLAPLMIDANRLVVTVNPADKPGGPAVVEVEGGLGGMVLNNQVVTKDRNARCGVSFSMNDQNQLTVRGCIALGQWAVEQKMAIRNPLVYAQGLIKQLLNESNIVLDGQVILGKRAIGSLLLASDTSKPIAQLMADTLKPSDNLYADSLFLHAAATLQHSPVNWADAQRIIKAFLEQQTHISLKDAVLMDGSGLSRQDKVTAEQTAGLLRFLYERFPLTFEYIAALPVSGRDGTLQRRFKRPEQQDLIRAKTGTMAGIVSLSGYLYTSNAHTLAFAMYVNILPGTKSSVAGRSRSLVDSLCNYFLQQKPATAVWTRLFFPKTRIQYQKNPTQAELQRSRQAKWRRLETVVKKVLQGQAVTVIYRGNELVLRDNQSTLTPVLHALQGLRKQYPFAVALAGRESSHLDSKPLVMHTEPEVSATAAQRMWIIREAVS